MIPDPVEIVRNVLKTHVIQPNKIHSIEKCSGCTWIGWHHDHHLAVQIIQALGSDQYVLCNDACLGPHFHPEGL